VARVVKLTTNPSLPLRSSMHGTVVPAAHATSCRAQGLLYTNFKIKRLSEAAASFTDKPLSVCRL
jgi:hypothetical protein